MAFLLLPGLFLTTWRKGARGELLFWILMFASMAASAAIIFRDEGSRTFAANPNSSELRLNLTAEQANAPLGTGGGPKCRISQVQLGRP